MQNSLVKVVFAFGNVFGFLKASSVWNGLLISLYIDNADQKSIYLWQHICFHFFKNNFKIIIDKQTS